MADSVHHTAAPTEWLDILAESEAELEAGLIVSGEEIMRELHEAAARLEVRTGFPRTLSTNPTRSHTQ